MSTLQWSATNADGLLADLDLPPAAYRALLKMRGASEAGGRISMDQGILGELLGLRSRCLSESDGAFPLVRHSTGAWVAKTGRRVVSSVEVPDAVGDGAAGRA